MNYEKKYKEALEIAQKLYQDCPNGKNDRLYHTTDLEKMFPELRESEDEKIRKELIEHIKDQQSSFISAPDCRDKYEEEENNKYNSWLAWLEKQGEQKPIIEMITPEESLGIDSETYNKIVDECIYGEQKPQRMVSAEAKEALYDKPACAWSEEDEHRVKDTIYFLDTAKKHYASTVELDACINWLKSLKERIGGE